ncbi:cellulose-binding protein [Streptomyces sp. Ru71]|uniref:cellulose-binding protein n=1 Tax=Streptomyces sp. Ru71 TaxID=2080746 RepID=UPI000CDCF5EA|nr:cellulose-binding protein [Streptomyces sp. Ru71]POX57105.1 cellulose-binding protein [Streptomyces sp. Ru71]
MSSAPSSPYGFVTVRGRGYRPEQVEACVAALAEERDAGWERAARLTVLAKQMEAEAERLREVVAELKPQTYDVLGERAQRLFALAGEEAEAVREGARRAAQEEIAQAEAYAEEVLRAAHEQADVRRAEACEDARQLLLAARAEADEIRVSARRALKAARVEELAARRALRQRTAGMLADQEKQHAARLAAADREAAARAEELDAEHARLTARAEEALAEAMQACADAEQAGRRRQDEARVQAAELLAEARLREEQIARETEEVLREHGERWDEVCAHMDRMRSSLTALTGRLVE